MFELMRQDSTQADGSVVLASGPAGSAGAGHADNPALVPTLPPLGARVSLPRIRTEFGARAARLSLGVLMLGAVAVVLFATSRATPLVPRSNMGFPHWESGPIHGLFGHLPNDWDALNLGLSGVLVAMLI